MKKFLCLLLISLFLLNLVACNEDPTPAVLEADQQSTQNDQTSAPCTHIWFDATCTTPKICLFCRATEGEALGHNMLAATCTEPATCEHGCGLTEGEALGHSGEFTVIGTPSEASTWQKSRVCSVCTETEIVESASELSLPTELPDPIYSTTTGTGGTNVKFIDGGKAQYTIVSANPDYDYLAQSLSVALYQQLGTTFKFVTSAQASTVTGKKIIIGRNPAAVLQDSSSLSYLGLLCYYGGSSIHITGYTKESVNLAFERFMSFDFSSYITKGSDGKKLVAVPSNVFSFVANPTNYICSDHTLLGAPISKYSIVVPSTMTTTDRFCINQLVDEIGRYIGVYLPVKVDANATGSNEIVFGKTSLPISQELYENLGENEYAIKSVNSCIYIASSHYSIDKAMRDALHMLYFGDIAETINIKIDSTADPTKRVEKSNDTDLRVMTANIICPADPDGVIEIATPYGITWEERVALACREIMLYLPDFVGMQEIQTGWCNSIYALMMPEILSHVSSEYDFVMYDQIPQDCIVDYWNPILYRKNVWQIEDKDVLYPDDFDTEMHRWQWALFSKIEDPTQKCIVINLHYPTRGNLPVQWAAVEIVNAKILELKELYPDVPIVLTGDCNTTLYTESYYKMIANTDLHCGSTLTTDCNDLGDVTGNDTTYGGDDMLDHILVSSDLLDVIAYRAIKDDYMVMVSDHFLIFTDLSYKNS